MYFSIFPGFHAAPLIPVSASKAITRTMPVAAYHSFHMHKEKKNSTRQPITYYNFRWLVNFQNHGEDFSSQPATSLAIPLFVKSRWTVVSNLVLQQISDRLLSIATEFSAVTFSRAELDPSYGMHYKINAQYMHLRREKKTTFQNVAWKPLQTDDYMAETGGTEKLSMSFPASYCNLI